MNGQSDELALLRRQINNIERNNKRDIDRLQNDYQLQIVRLKDQISEMAKQLAERTSDRQLKAIKVVISNTLLNINYISFSNFGSQISINGRNFTTFYGQKPK